MFLTPSATHFYEAVKWKRSEDLRIQVETDVDCNATLSIRRR